MLLDWNQTDLGYSPIETEDYNKILPLVLHYLTPEPVAIIGNGWTFIIF